LKYDGGTAYVEIGHDTTLREYVTVNAATATGERTAIGNHCHVLAYCHIAHECILGDHVIMSNATQLAGHVIVEDHVVFGGMGGVHQFVRIGTMVMVSATAKVVQDVLPFCLVDGNPAVPVTINKVGLERNGKSPETIDAIQKAYRTVFRANLTVDAAVNQLREAYPGVEEVERIAHFAETSERGLSRPKSGRR
ncbi:MAG: acyl-ACP--UDP-N-acetylglucosamine O-acyltransferase, partial [Lentisphaerae bacterium]|nr:acyl-ACP--UDP-N-acetylglucosamine O-acyltransferase [Lentisphaerota bacterium]